MIGKDKLTFYRFTNSQLRFLFLQNNVLTKKVDDLRIKLVEECQKTETFKMDVSKNIEFSIAGKSFLSFRFELKAMN